ncbi:uncharacterized protein LOC144664036 isoform X2 [Oculina patagonica]
MMEPQKIDTGLQYLMESFFLHRSCLVPHLINSLVLSKQIQEKAVVQLNKYVCVDTTPETRKVLIVLEVTVIKLGSEVSVRIGNPKNINVNEISNSDHQPQQNGTSAQQILSGMPKTTVKASDSDEDSDDLPDLVDCTDDEDSDEEEYRKKTTTKAKGKGKDKPAPKAKNNAECADMWYKLSKDDKEKHIHVMRVYLLSPFLFGQVYQDDKWINWAYESKLLPSKSSFEIKALDEEHFDAVDLVETAFNKLAENVLLKNKDGLVKTLDIIGNARMTMSQHLDKAVTCAESFLAFTNLRDKIKLKPGISKKQGDVALLLAHNQVSEHIKQLAAGVDLLEKFNKRCKQEEDQTADKKKEGNDAFSSGKFTAAISVYTRALHMSPYNHVLYGNRSQSYLKTKDLWDALTDGRRAVVLKADWHKAQYRYAQAFFEMGNLTRAKEVNREACKICSDKKDLESQFEKFEKVTGGAKGKTTTSKKGSKAITTKRKGSGGSELEDLPDLVDPDSSDTSRNYSDDDCVPELVELATSEDSDDSDDEESEDPQSDSMDGCDSSDSAARKRSSSVSGSKKREPSTKVKQLIRESVQDKAKKEEKDKKTAELPAKKEIKKPEKKNKNVKSGKLANVESDKPKRAPTAYFIFLAEFRKEMSGKKLDGDQKIPALAGEKWRSMTDKDKEKYKQLESIAKKKHEVEMEEWRKATQMDQNGNSQRLKEFNSYLKQGSKAILEEKFEMAVNSYGEAVTELKHLQYQYQIYEMKEIDFVILLYSFGAACLELGSFEELIAAKKHFEIIVVEHKNVVFPLAYLGTGRVFYKQNRFTEALEPLEEGLALVNKLGDEKLAAYRWPGSQVIIDDTKPGKLLSALQTLIRICRHPPRPDANCRYSDCSNKPQIYLTDPDYKGYIRLICDENCKVDFHPVCWKKQKSNEEEGKTGDKDFLDDTCMTPDCVGSVINVQIYDSEGLKTEFKTEKPTAKLETKPKAPKQYKVKASAAGIKQKKKKEKDELKIEEEAKASDSGEEKVVKNPPPPPPLPVQREEKPSKEDHSLVEKGGYNPSDSSIAQGEGVFILKKEEDEESNKGLPLKGVGKVKTKKKKLKNTQTLDEFLKDRGGQQTFRPALGEDGEDLGEIPHPKCKFDLVPPPPGWSQQEMEAPFAIPPHLQGDAAEFEASYRAMDSNVFSFSPGTAPVPNIDLKAVTEYVSSMLHEILRANGALELADPNIMQPLSMLPDSYQDIISNAGGLRPILEQSGKFLFDGNRVMLPEDKEFEDFVKTFKPTQSNNPFLDRTISGSKNNDEKLQNGNHDGKSIWDNDNLVDEKSENGVADKLCVSSSSTPINPSAKEFVCSPQSDSLTACSSKTSLASDATLKDVELVDDEIEDEKDAINEQSKQTSNGKIDVESALASALIETMKSTLEREQETYADMSPSDFKSQPATLKVEFSFFNGKNFEDSSGDLSQAISTKLSEQVEKGTVAPAVREDIAPVQTSHKRNSSDPVITSKTKSVQTQPNVKSKGVGTEPVPEPFKAEYQRAVSEKDALQARLQENTERHSALLNKNNAEVEKVKKKLADALQEKEKYSKEVQEVKQKNQEEIRKLRQTCEDKDDKIKTLNHKLLQDAQEKSNVVSNLKKELSACKGQFTSEKDSWNKERAEKDELVKNTKLQHLQQQARAQDAEIKLLELRRDVGLRFLERAYQESHITINNLIQAVNARIAGPKVEELITTWKNYASECHQRVLQCKQTFNEQIELLKTGRTLASVPQLTIPGPPPYPAIPVLQSVVPGQPQNQPQPSAESSSSAPRTTEPPVPTTSAGASAGGSSAVAPPTGVAASVNGDKPPVAGLPPPAAAVSSAAAAAIAPDKARPSNSFEKIMLRLSTMYPNFTRLELTGFIKEVRHNKHGSLTGLSLEDIVASVSELVEQKKKAGLLRTAPVTPANSSPTIQRAANATVPQKTQPMLSAKPAVDASKMAAIASGSYEEDPCVICHEDMNASYDIVTLECGHRYHSGCIRKWLMGEQSTCPTCRVHALLPDEFPRLK